MKPIPGYDGYFADEYGDVFSDRRGTLKKLRAVWNGRYYNVSLYCCGKQESVHVHVAVCLAFHGPRPDGLVCRHRDDDPHNNRPGNLLWGTQTENNRDRVKHGSIQRGEKHHRSKLKDWEVVEIRALLGIGVRERILATAYGVSEGAIKHIRHRLATPVVRRKP